MRRRSFLMGAGTAAGSAWAGIGDPRPEPRSARARRGGNTEMREDALAELPSFCSHEHWGSVDAIGMLPEGFRADVECGALPKRPADLFDILLDPYFRGQLAASGGEVDHLPRPAGLADFRAWAAESPEDAFAALDPLIERHRATGAFQCIRHGLRLLYGQDIADRKRVDLHGLNRAIAERYGRLFDWYDEARTRLGFSGLIRPVHPEYYWRMKSPASAHELKRCRSVVRIDPFLHMWPAECPRRDALAELTGIDPVDAASWRAFLEKIMNRAAEHGAVGIKQLQAYGRSLDYPPRDDARIRWRGDLAPDEAHAFKDWMVHACCEQAEVRGWPHQIHVGTHNLPQSSPLPLADMAKRYPKMKLVLLHNWPFIRESGWLARHHANVYLDTCWLPVLNPAFYRGALTEWMGYVPAHKILCGHDATSIEMAAGSALFVRNLLTEVLRLHANENHLSAKQAKRIAAGFMHENAVRLYGLSSPDISTPAS
ncbi:MAG TPA: amidohydrolase family protein [Candidatus Hydrogenedentes bacterium]|nr:amidohydrolase family protein [Candidatus Hydrogenedentota bacterium]HPC16416.1 amidohydrolase family protein [Candidatus Hydrogenedentota bacterium]HRT20349.1 amidohydrolase family protein [Candidatus Hydrogenedentota bacterium]HRT65075.1 amidohydrolase family protein [Candidatus Hydrogenedentota bacterium]